MSVPLLTTKLYIPPPRPGLVPRPRLTKLLEAGLRGKLTLVSAPAGYGKTTLVSEWIHQKEEIHADRVAWLSLDEGDNNPVRFFSHFILALQGIHPDIGIDILSILDSDADLQFENLLTELINNIAASEARFILILDDYHVIHDIHIHQALDFLFDHLPPGMHTVIISRADPPMPLGRLRVQRQLKEIRELDLRFTIDETSAFFNNLMGLNLSPEDIHSLETRTEGWVAGLQLAGLTLQGQRDRHGQVVAITGSHRHLIDYLIHEVLSRQPGKVQMFLLHTSVLERFNASLCDALTLESTSRELLIFLEKANLFLTPLDDKRQWYRYHHLFADFLRQHLRATSPEIIPELHKRACLWYETHGMMDEAIECALVGGNLEGGARLLDGYAETLISTEANVAQMLRWANRLPPEVRAHYPRLCIYHAWALQFEYQLDSVDPTLALAEAYLTDAARLPESLPPSQIIGHVNTIRAYTAAKRGEFQQSVDLSLSALEALPDEDTRGVHLLRGVTLLGLGMGYLELGQMEAAYQAYQMALPLNLRVASHYAALSCIHYMMFVDIARGELSRGLTNGEKGLFWIEEWSSSERQKRRPARMLAHLRWNVGRVLYERDELDKAAEYYSKAAEYYELVGSWHRIRGYARLVDLNLALGKIDIAHRFLHKLKRLSLTPGTSPSDIPMAAMIAERSLNLSQGRPDLDDLFTEAVEWAKTSGLENYVKSRYEDHRYEFLILARVWIAQGRAEEAIPLLEQLIAAAERDRRNGELIAYLSLLAIAYQTINKTDKALAHLSRALALGEPEGYVRTFVDLGSPMHDLLKLAARQGTERDYLSRLLSAFPEYKREITIPPAPISERRGIKALLEPLNDREVQILRLLATRFSYKEIAEELYLSLNTVKWYTKNIYSKLGVSKKGEAAARAQELGII